MMIFGYIFITLLGILVGSFLNVLIYRLPIMMKRDWHMQSCDLLKQHIPWNGPKLNLMQPHSHCPHCKAPIKPWNNIPIISFLLQKGRCKNCHARISYRYPFIELLAGLVAAITFWRFQWTWNMGLVLVLGWGLITASAIDSNEHFIPDFITLPLLWLGLLANLFFVFSTPSNAIAGAIVGYVFFWCIAKLFYLCRKKEGLGHGDFKLLALFGAWLGMLPLLNIIILSCILGILVSLCLMYFKKIEFSSQIPFGPFLALSGWCTMVFGDFITQTILR